MSELWDWADVAAIGLMAEIWGEGKKRVRDQTRGIKNYLHMKRTHRVIAYYFREIYAAGVEYGEKSR